jgi:hypothetical protein
VGDTGELGFVKLFLEYRFGKPKPKQMQEITVNGNGLRDWTIVVEPTIKLPDGKEILL